MQIAIPFLSVHLGDVLSAAAVVTGIIALRLDFNKKEKEQKKEREEWLQAQTQMHTENKMRLEALMQFQDHQMDVNSKRDIQVSELQRQTATITEIAKGMDRRLQMIEDRMS